MSRTIAPMQYAAPRAAPAPTPWLDRVLFFVFLTVLCVRPLISENFLPDVPSFLENDNLPKGPTPATIAILDGILLTAAAIVFVSDGGRWRGGRWFWAGTAALGLALGLSVAAAGDKRLAANAGANLLIAVLTGGALVRLMRVRWMPRLLLAAMLAGGGVSALKCILQKTSEFESDLRQWREVEKPKLAARGVDLENPDLVNYERRLQSAEPFGFLFHPNITASCLMMCLLAGGGLLIGQAARAQPRQRAESAAAVLLAALFCAPLALGLWFTGSLGALLAALGGLLLLVVLGIARRWITPRAGAVAAVLLLGYVALIAGGASYGVRKGTLPHPSLAFRWHYWTAGLKAFQDAPLTGLGRENFSAAFLKYKSPQSTEEVRDPHNVWVSLLVELGPLGLLGGALLAAACVYAPLRRLDGRAEDGDPREILNWPRLLLAGVGVLTLQALLGGLPLSNPNIALVWAVEIAGAWLLLLIAVAWLIEQPDPAGGLTAWLTAGLAAALLGALVHNLVDFSLLTPAGISMFVVMAAVALTLRPAPAFTNTNALKRGAARGPRHWPKACAAALGIAAYCFFILIPTLRMETRLDQMRESLRYAATPSQVDAILNEALRGLTVDAWDAGAARVVAQTAAQQVRRPDVSGEQRLAWLQTADQAAQTALRRNPRAAGAYRWLAMIGDESAMLHQLLARPDAAQRAREGAVQHWRRAVEYSPTNPRLRIDAGTSWLEYWRQTQNAEAARTAAAHFRAAITIDEQRPPGDTARLQPKELARIAAGLAELKAEN